MTEGRGRGVKALESGWHGFWRLPWTMSLASGTWAPVTTPGNPLSLVKLSPHAAPKNSPRTLSVEGCPTQKRVSLLPGGPGLTGSFVRGSSHPSWAWDLAQTVSSWLFRRSASSLVIPVGFQHHASPTPACLPGNTGCSLCPEVLSRLCPALASVLDKTYMLLCYRFSQP